MYTAIVILAFLAAFLIAWRFASRRESLPCPVWLRWLVEIDNPFTRISRAAVIIEHLDVHPGMAVLDVGCGPGRLTLPLAKRVGSNGRIVAVDIQAGMLNAAKVKAEKAGLANIQYVQAGAGEGKLDKNCFDRAILVTVLGEIPDRESALKEIFGALKPGGVLSITEIVFDPHYQSQRTVRRLAIQSGFIEKDHFGNVAAFTLNFVKPAAG